MSPELYTADIQINFVTTIVYQIDTIMLWCPSLADISWIGFLIAFKSAKMGNFAILMSVVI